MTQKELNDIAYEIATGNSTTETLNLEEWSNCNTEDILWEPFERYGSSFTESHVSQIADDIIYRFQHLCSDYNE